MEQEEHVSIHFARWDVDFGLTYTVLFIGSLADLPKRLLVLLMSKALPCLNGG
jgi:hypothetical protein